jgi:hypothetical protein
MPEGFPLLDEVEGLDDLDRRKMSFEDDDAYAQLRDEGKVVTARTREYEPRPVWISRGRTEGKEFDATRYYLGEFEWADFVAKVAPALYAQAGFDSRKEWCDRIVDLQGETPERVHVYVVKRDDEESEGDT